MIHGGLVGGQIRLAEDDGCGELLAYLAAHGLRPAEARRVASGLPVWPEEQVPPAAALLQEIEDDAAAGTRDAPERGVQLLGAVAVAAAGAAATPLGRAGAVVATACEGAARRSAISTSNGSTGRAGYRSNTSRCW